MQNKLLRWFDTALFSLHLYLMVTRASGTKKKNKWRFASGCQLGISKCLPLTQQMFCNTELATQWAVRMRVQGLNLSCVVPLALTMVQHIILQRTQCWMIIQTFLVPIPFSVKVGGQWCVLSCICQISYQLGNNTW